MLPGIVMLGSAHTAFHTTENLVFQKTNQYQASKKGFNFLRKACLFDLYQLEGQLGKPQQSLSIPLQVLLPQS